MAIEHIDDLISQSPPAKRARLEKNSSNMDSTTAIHDADELHSTEEKPVVTIAAPDLPTQSESRVKASPPAYSGIPGLGRLENAPTAPVEAAEVSPQPVVAAETEEIAADQPAAEDATIEMSGVENTQGDVVAIAEAKEIVAVPSVTEAVNTEMSGVENSEGQSVTHALEAFLDGLDTPASKDPESGPPPVAEGEPVAGEQPEWEVDSSPYESSSDDSSDDSSSEEDSDEDGDNVYKLLSPEEQARILMEGDGGSDDEGGGVKTKGAGGQLRTKNEIPEEVIQKPDVTITPEMRIEELGVVETIVENIILIKAKTSGEYRALESGSVLCMADRSVIGVVSETLGRVQQPLYTVRFTNAGEITEAGISVGTKVFYSEQHAKYALTQVLKAYKGSDASNLHDEEVGDEEMEFSDDEAEAEHKRRLKQKKLERRGGKMQQNGGSSRGGHPLQHQHLPSDGNQGLSYDDVEDDGPYKPLARPTGFANTVGRSEAPQEGAYPPAMSNRGGRGDLRGRGRGRGDRGRGRGGFQDRRDISGYSQPPQNHPNSGYGSQQSPVSHGNHSFNPQQGAGYQPSPMVPPHPNNFYQPQPQSQAQYSPQQPPLWPQFPQQQFPQTFQGFPNMPNGWPNMPRPPPLPSGAFINPAFFAGNQNGAQNPWNPQQGQQDGGNRGGSS